MKRIQESSKKKGGQRVWTVERKEVKKRSKENKTGKIAITKEGCREDR